MMPSRPTASRASAITSPTSLSSLAEIDATWAISARPEMVWPMSLRRGMTRPTARSIPRLRRMGLAPWSMARMPARIIAWASTVAVVVPSPAMSLVLVATSFTSCAPMSSNGSRRWISLAMVTPSLVIVGVPVSFSSTTLRPLGPSVTLTLSASWLTPASRRRRASWSNRSSLAIFSPLRGSRDQDAAAPEPPLVEVVQCVTERVERVRRGVQLHLSLCGQDHELDQVVVRADQVADEVDLGRDDVDGGHAHHTPVADDVVTAGAPEHGQSRLDRAALSGEVE